MPTTDDSTEARHAAHRASYAKYDLNGWHRVQDAALDWLAAHLERRPPLGANPVNISALVLSISGVTSLCDWIGSSAEDFPPTGDLISPLNYCSYSRERARLALRRRGFLDQERLRTAFSVGKESSFMRLFPTTPTPRPLQRTLIGTAAVTNPRPNLMIAEAPMGDGKTEAAIWWAAAVSI